MKQHATLILFIFTALKGFTQSFENCPGTEWQACYGGSSDDGATTVIPTADGGYFVAGWSRSDDFDLSANEGKGDFFLLKITAAGSKEWSRSYGGPENDMAWDALQTSDGGFLIAGMAGGSGGDVSNNLGQEDAWLIRVDEGGNLLWEKSMGTAARDAATRIVPGPGNSWYLLTGTTDAFLFDDFPFYTGAREKRFSIFQIADNGTVVSTHSFSADHLAIRGLQDGNLSLLIDGSGAKTIQVRDRNFNLLQEVPLPQDPNPDITWIEALQLANGDWAILGRRRADSPSGRKDEVVAQRTTPDGTAVWFRSLLSNLAEDLWLEAVQPATGDKIAIALDPAPLTGVAPDGDYWAAWLEPNGEISNLRQLGGTKNDHLYSLIPTIDGGWLLAGTTESEDGDVQDCYAGFDAWLVKLAALPGSALPADTLVCPGEDLIFDIPEAPNFTVQWQDGSFGNSFSVPESGIYFYEGRQNECIVLDTSNVRLLETEAPISPTDTTLCQDSTLLLDATVDGAALYLWQDGSQEPLYQVIKPDRYLVKVVVEDCVLEDSITVHWCQPCLAIPNAFTPNGDGVNDFFTPVLQCPFPAYHLQVFNRWGTLIFETQDPEKGWDGTFDGLPAPSEVYFYQLSYQEFQGEPGQRRQGDVVLLR